jgi:adenine-specific DNA-methyltransferase
VNITGFELNKTIFESIQHIGNDTIKLLNLDYLTHDDDKKYDLIIGNPPFFVMKKKEVDESYYDYFEGRPNIFILFIIRSLKLLNENGILSFILPKNFLNCLYYDKTRKYINDNFTILNILDCNEVYIDTQQETVIIIIQNKIPVDKSKYVFKIGSFTIFGLPDNITKIKSLYNNSKTLCQMGFSVSVGNVVWNQCKTELTNDESKTLLIYSSDIKNNKLEIQQYKNNDKKNYINKKGFKNPLLVINRGYGVGKYIFNHCLINETDEIEYLIENHLICIKYKNSNSISKDELIELYKKIIKSFENDKTKEFINIYFGNNAINTTELCNILPMYDC